MPTINHNTKVISVLQSELVPLGGSLYEYDINTLRLALKTLEDDADGMTLDDTHKHTPPTTLAGVTFARQVEIINGYTVTFQDGSYSVNIIGGNSNLGDVINRNSAGVNTANSAGMVQVDTGGGTFTADDRTMLQLLHRIGKNRMEVDIDAQQLVLYADNGTTVLQRWNLATADGEVLKKNYGIQTKRSVPLL